MASVTRIGVGKDLRRHWYSPDQDQVWWADCGQDARETLPKDGNAPTCMLCCARWVMPTYPVLVDQDRVNHEWVLAP